MDLLTKETERIDDLGVNDLKIIQDKEGFCFGVDAVLLANYCKIKKNSKVVDLGTGTGIIPILIAGKSEASEVIGVEIQEEVANMANRSVVLNNLQAKIKIINEDLKNITNILKPGEYNVVTSNPPYMHSDGIKNINDKKAISRHEIKCNLEDVIKAASKLLMPHGKFYMIHRPIRLADIITIGRMYKLEPKEIVFIHPKYNKAPNIMLMQFTKGAKPELKVLDPIYVYDDCGEYTNQIREIYSKDVIGDN